MQSTSIVLSDFAKYSVRQNRDELVSELNRLMGPPTALGQQLQESFISGAMGQLDMTEFVKVYYEIIESKTRWL